MSLRCFVNKLDAGVSDSSRIRVIQLCEAEARHARLSRRLSVGDGVELFDGQGCEGRGEIVKASKSVVEVAVRETAVRPRPLPTLNLAVAMPKGPRQDFLIEKCTELGVATIQPIVTERSVAGVSEHRREKWQRTAIEAAKQSGQCWLPELHAPVNLQSVLGGVGEFDLVFVAMVPREEPLVCIEEIVGALHGSRRILAFIGPEGGWAEAESRALVAGGGKAISLGPNVLRVETAAIAVASIIHACSS